MTSRSQNLGRRCGGSARLETTLCVHACTIDDMRTSTLLTAAAFAALSNSLAGAQTIQDTQRINTNGFNPQSSNAQDGVAIAVAGTSLHVAWADQFGTDQFSQDIYYARSTDDGATYSTPVRIDTGDGANAFDSDFAKIAVSDDGQKIVVVWQELRDAIANAGSGQDVFYNVSMDGGTTWMASALPLSANAGTDVTSDVDRIWLEASGDDFHCVWEEDWISAGGSEETWYTRSTDGGATWSTPIILSPASGSDDVDEPKVAADGDLVIVVYVDVNNDVVAHRSVDGGANFNAGVIIESDTAGNADDPFIEILGDTVLVGWTENTAEPGGEEAHCAVSNDGGATWRPEETLSVQQAAQAGSDTDGPGIAIQSPMNMFVVYDEDSQDIAAGGPGGSAGNVTYVAYTNDGGATWTKDVPINPNSISNRSRIVANPGVVTACFEQNGNGANIISYVHSFDGGTTWSAPFDIVTSGPDTDLQSAIEYRDVVISPVSNTVTTVFLSNLSGANEVYACGIRYDVTVGQNYCTAVANTTGAPGAIRGTGSNMVSSDSFGLVAEGLPANQFGIFIVSSVQGFIPGVSGTSNGNLCLGGAIGRFNGPGQILSSGAAGTFSLGLDLSAIPQGAVSVAVAPGDTWNFQAWYREGSGLGSNFTNGLQVDFQ